MSNGMKVVILCGGRGTRLREETEYKPKPLVLIGNKPILWHIMKTYSHWGFNDFVLCLGYKGEMIKNYFLKYNDFNNDFTLDFTKPKPRTVVHDKNDINKWKITFVDTGLKSMTGARIARVKKYVKDKDFLLAYGDGLSDINIKDLYRFHKKKKRIITVSGIYPSTFFGCLTIKGDMVCKFMEKPVIKNYVSGGFFVCNRKIFDYLSEDESCVFEEDALPKLTKEGQMSVYKHKGCWYTMNTHKDYEELNKMWNSGKAGWKIWR